MLAVLGQRGLGTALGRWVVHLYRHLEVSKEVGHSSARMEVCSKGEVVRQALLAAPFPLFWGVGGGEENAKMLKKNTHIENGKTVRPSYVWLDSGKFIFSLFNVFFIFFIFSIMNVFLESEK